MAENQDIGRLNISVDSIMLLNIGTQYAMSMNRTRSGDEENPHIVIIILQLLEN